MLDRLFGDITLPMLVYRPFPYVVLIFTIYMGYVLPPGNAFVCILLIILFAYSVSIIAIRWSYRRGNRY